MRKAILLFALIIVMAGSSFAQPAHSVTLTWQWSQGTGGVLTGFLIERGTVSGGPYVQIGAVPSPTMSYVDQSATGNVLVEGTTYYYVVVATGPGGNALPSPQASQVIPYSPPCAVTGITSSAK